MKRGSVAFVAALLLAVPALASETYVPPPDATKTPRVTVQATYARKCAKCHGVDRSDKVVKAPSAWISTVERMRSKDAAWISSVESDRIARWLAGRDLAKAKCNKCHPDSRADVLKTETQWQSTLDRMQGKEASWISNPEKESIKAYLTDLYLLVLE